MYKVIMLTNEKFNVPYFQKKREIFTDNILTPAERNIYTCGAYITGCSENRALFDRKFKIVRIVQFLHFNFLDAENMRNYMSYH